MFGSFLFERIYPSLTFLGSRRVIGSILEIYALFLTLKTKPQCGVPCFAYNRSQMHCREFCRCMCASPSGAKHWTAIDELCEVWVFDTHFAFVLAALGRQQILDLPNTVPAIIGCYFLSVPFVDSNIPDMRALDKPLHWVMQASDDRQWPTSVCWEFVLLFVSLQLFCSPLSQFFNPGTGGYDSQRRENLFGRYIKVPCQVG